MSEFLSLAIQAALQAGEILKRGFGTEFAISSKNEGKQNLVTEYDTASEKCILSTISQKYPDHQFFAEESGRSKGKSSSMTWLIDPLDGTVNFAHNIPFFSVSIAAALNNEVICGVVYNPLLNELFFAEKGKGAFLNGNKLRVKKTSSLDEALLATGFPYNVDKNPLNCVEKFCSIAKSGAPIRRLGSAALDLSYIAAGRFDAFWEVVLQPWDFAAGKLILEEAGGKATLYDGSAVDLFQTGPLLATNGLLHDYFIAELCS